MEGRAGLETWLDAGILPAWYTRLWDAIEERRLAGHLTPQERRVLELLATHLSSAEIAQRLYMSRNTLKTHMRDLYRKLDVHSRSQAVERSLELGLRPHD